MFADPEHIVGQFGLTEGMQVADLGAGAGYYSIAAAKRVGTSGRVYAVEIQQELMERTAREAKSAGSSAIEIIWGNIEMSGGTKIADGTLDAVIVANVLFQIADKETFIAEIKRILKLGGRALVVDWAGSFAGMGPQPSDVISKDDARTLFKRYGFAFEREIDAGAHHYGFIVTNH